MRCMLLPQRNLGLPHNTNVIEMGDALLVCYEPNVGPIVRNVIYPNQNPYTSPSFL